MHTVVVCKQLLFFWCSTVAQRARIGFQSIFYRILMHHKTIIAFCYLDHVAIGILMQSIRIRMIDFERALLLLLVLFARNSDGVLIFHRANDEQFVETTNSADWLFFICSPNMFHSIYMQTFSLAHQHTDSFAYMNMSLIVPTNGQLHATFSINES